MKTVLVFNYDNLMNRFGCKGVILTDVQPHENLCEGELLVGINGRSLDTFGNFVDNGKPYFSAFKNHPETTVKLMVANEEGKREVGYTYSRLASLPRIHEPGCTPFQRQVPVVLDGVVVLQMNAAMAKQSYPEYLKPDKHDKVVGVVVKVDPLCPAWNIQKIAPGHLLVKVDGKEMEQSLEESVKGAKFVTFKAGDRLINKLI